MERQFYLLTMTSIQTLKPLLRRKSTISAKKNIMAFAAMKQMKRCGVIEMYTTTLISIISFYLMGIGITAPVENKWEYLVWSGYEIVHVEIGFSLFDSYAVVNPFIAWRNFKLKGKPEKERAYRKYGIRQARLDLIQKWTKLCSRHYKETLPHKKKRIRLVITWRPRKLGAGRIQHRENIHFPKLGASPIPTFHGCRHVTGMIEKIYIWDKKPTCETWISIPRRASQSAKGKRILCCLWAKNNSYVLGLLYGLSWCISDLLHFKVRLFPKDAWNAKWDMRALPYICAYLESYSCLLNFYDNFI